MLNRAWVCGVDGGDVSDFIAGSAITVSDWRPSALYLQAIYGHHRAIPTQTFDLYGVKVGFSGELHAAPITYDEFVAQVCRYRTSDVLRALAGQSSELFGPNPDPANVQVVNAWSAAAIVKVAMLQSSEEPAEHDLTMFDLLALFRAFARVHETEVDDSNNVLRIFTQYMSQQFGWDESVIEELSRTVALFRGEATDDHKLVRRVIETALGIPIEDAVGAAFIIFVFSGMSGGRWKPELFDDESMHELFAAVPKESVLRFARYISADKGLFAQRHHLAMEKVDTKRHLTHRLWEFNPLTTHPIIKDATGENVVPVAWAVLRRITPSVLFYDGISKEEDTFPGALGNVVEAYVGMQLRLLEPSGAKVIGSFKYPTGDGHAHSTDWFVELPQCLLFVEVKSTRLSLQERMGDFPQGRGVRKVLTRAFEQINRDVLAFRGRRKEFLENLPTSRKPLVGMVVTSESVYAANIPEFRSFLPIPEIGITVTSLRFLERMVLMRSRDLGRELLAIQRDPARSAKPLQLALLGTEDLGHNPILRQVSDDLPIFKWRTGSTLGGIS